MRAEIFGPQVIARAKELNVARLAIKALAHGPWRKERREKVSELLVSSH